MLNLFRLISFIEGLSYLLILSVTLGVLSRDLVSVLGMIHGALFVVYVLTLLATAVVRKWSLVYTLVLFVASLVPFAFIAVEWHVTRPSQKSLQQ